MTSPRFLLAATTASLAIAGAAAFTARQAIAADPASGSSEIAQRAAADSRAVTAADDERSLRRGMAAIVDDAITPGHTDQLLGHFAMTSTDRARTAGAALGANRPPNNAAGQQNLNDNAPQHANDNNIDAGAAAAAGARRENRNDATAAAALDAAIAQLRKDWRDKYDRDFTLRGNETAVFNDRFARIDVGDYGDAARTAGERIRPPAAAGAADDGRRSAAGNQNVNDSAPQHAPTGINSSGAGGNGPSSDSGRQAASAKQNVSDNAPQQPVSPAAREGAADAARRAADRGDAAVGAVAARNRAVVTIPESHGALPVTVRFAQDGETWKIDSSAPIDRAQLQSALARHLEMADRELKQSGPADPNEGYRAVAHHVFLAINDVQNAGSTPRRDVNDATNRRSDSNTR